MKLYNSPQYLQKIINEDCGNKFEYLFKNDIVLKLYSDKENNLIVYNTDGKSISIDSTVAFLLSDYYKSLGKALERLEFVTNQTPETTYEESKDLGILFNEIFISFANTEFKIHKSIQNGYPTIDAHIDEIGGFHDSMMKD